MQLSDYGQKTNLYLLDFIKFGDAKAGSILALTGIVSGAVATRIENVLTLALGLDHKSLSGALVALTIVSVLAIMISCLLGALRCIEALSPRVDGSLLSLNSFPDIAKKSSSEFVNDVRALTPDDVAVQYAHHNHVLATIADKKFAAIKAATWHLKGVVFGTAAFTLLVIVAKALSSILGSST